MEEFLKSKNILSPEEVSKKEKLLFKKYHNLKFCTNPPEDIIKLDTGNPLYLVKLFHIFRERPFFVIVKKKYNFKKLRIEYIISTFLRVNAENNDILWAFIFTFRLNILLENRRKAIGPLKTISFDEITDLIEENFSFLEQEVDKKQLLERIKTAGWTTNFTILEEFYSRYHLLFKNI
jgi:hypothetical protein